MNPSFFQRMVPGRSGVGWLVAILVLAGVLWFKFSNKNEASAEIKQQAVEIVESFDVSAQEREYCMTLVDKCHDHAFGTSYQMGGRRSSPEFDSDKYIQEFLEHMTTLSRADGEKHVAEYITRYRIALAALSTRPQE